MSAELAALDGDTPSEGASDAPGWGGPITLGEPGSDGFHRSWIMLFPEGRYEHPQYGKLNFTRARLAEIKKQFDGRVRKIDIALDANHDQDKATGWLEQLQLRDAQPSDGAPAGLWGQVRWTPYGVQLLKDQLYRYFSPEFGPWEDPHTGQKYDDVLIGGGLTNRPFLKEMPVVTLAETSSKPWGSVNKSRLPASCFLIVGDPNKKATWRLPVYESPDGKTRGPLNVNGVLAAYQALNGAHGQTMQGVPASVRAKVNRWHEQFFGKSQSAQASERREARAGGVEESKMALEFDEETQSFADGDDETQNYDDGMAPDGAFDEDSDTHGAMTTDGHSHGKFADHSHDGDGDHSDAPLKDSKSGKKMSDGRSLGEPRTARQLREAYTSQQKQLAEMRESLYRRDVADTLATWESGKFQFSEAPKSAGGAGGKGVSLSMVALSKRFTEAYSRFMLNEGADLSDTARKQVNHLIETALSAAVVDLSQKGASFDQEQRRTIRGGRAGQRVALGEEVVELAQKRAEARGKKLSEMTYNERLAAMIEAEAETGDGQAY